MSHLMCRLATSEDEPNGGKVSQVGEDSSGPGPGQPASADDDAATRVFSRHGQVTWPQMTDPANLPTEVSPANLPTLAAAPYEHGRGAADRTPRLSTYGTPGVNAPSDGGPYASTAPGKIVRCPSL